MSAKLKTELKKLQIDYKMIILYNRLNKIESHVCEEEIGRCKLSR